MVLSEAVVGLPSRWTIVLLTTRVDGIETNPTLVVLGKFAGRFLSDLLKPLFYTYLFPFSCFSHVSYLFSGTKESPHVIGWG